MVSFYAFSFFDVYYIIKTDIKIREWKSEMNRKSFFENDKATLTVMVQAKTPNRIKELVDKASESGGEAFGIQLEVLEKQYQTKEIYKELFEYTKDKPVYVTNYRSGQNEGKSDEQLADELLEIAECGADLCDVIGDLYDPQPDEVAIDKNAIEKQKKLIEKLHKKGAKVLMSSHVMKYTSPERVLEIARQHKECGADISKIVTDAENMSQQLENLKIINMLKENLGIPFLFLCGGKCEILRRIGGRLGCCMYLCVNEYDELATKVQPLLKDMKQMLELEF